MDIINNLTDRLQDIRNAPSPGAYVKQRIGENAQALSLAGIAQMQVESAMEALTKLVCLLYQADTDGSFANIDRHTWRILVPAPFGSTGWKRWGLRAWEADVLRHILTTRAQGRNPLFEYNDVARTWHLNLNDYATLDAAKAYLQKRPISLTEWKTECGSYRERRITSVSKSRQSVIKP